MKMMLAAPIIALGTLAAGAQAAVEDLYEERLAQGADSLRDRLQCLRDPSHYAGVVRA